MRKEKRAGRSFKVDARALLSLGRESIKDKATALLELVKNAYDADATVVQIDFVSCARLSSRSYIRIADDGVGMTSQEIDQRWLRVGFSHKRRNKTSLAGRRGTGEKGVGRLSADRLGAGLELRSKKDQFPSVGIRVNWDDFDKDGSEIGQVPIYELGDPERRKATRPNSKTGTEIIVRNLRQVWTESDLDALEQELASLVPPGRVTDFALRMKRSATGAYTKINSLAQKNAELKFTGSFSKSGLLTYRISRKADEQGARRPVVQRDKTPWESINQTKGKGARYSLGAFDVELSFFLRAGVKLGEGLRISSLRTYLDTQGGVRVYRDLVRVKPYGDSHHSEGDWLGLAARKASNPAGAAREDFRINNNQLVGQVLIGRDTNPKLADSAAREGLIHGDAYDQLKQATMWCITLLEAAYHSQYVLRKPLKPQGRVDVPAIAKEVKAAITGAVAGLKRAQAAHTLKDENKILMDSMRAVIEVSEKVGSIERSVEEMESQATIYRGLATVGISSAVFGHETEGALAQAKLSLSLAGEMLEEDPLDGTSLSVEFGKISRAVDRVNLWGNFALKRVRKDKRKRVLVSVNEIALSMLSELTPIFQASGIKLEHRLGEDMPIRAFPMDVEAVLLNLLTNAYHAAGLTDGRLVRVRTSIDSRKQLQSLVVMDSGPGIVPEVEEQIWSPLFSTKPGGRGRAPGTGLGLAIVKSICDDMGALTRVEGKGTLGGASFFVSFKTGGKDGGNSASGR